VSSSRTRAPRSTPRRRSGGAVLLGVGLAGAVVVALLLGGRAGGDDALAVSYDPDSRVLDFTAETFDGQTVSSAQLQGTPVVLNFYASWCTICDRELPDFQRVSERLDGRLQVLGVNPQSNDTDAAQAEMIERSGVTYPTVRDPRDDLLRPFNTTGGLPTTLFVDGDGVVRKVHNGLLTEQLLLEEIERSLGVRG
jgi:cytochrome c biogenesis protein CcmG/thiol:disulfide interchange protein DsbE